MSIYLEVCFFYKGYYIWYAFIVSSGIKNDDKKLQDNISPSKIF